ncbi:MAG: hypothetical protein IPM23_14515 [Candidatus Melainabacteria bacterium]|nr:hypothetical protein [Candidatus Melainabacteria bacterium]
MSLADLMRNGSGDGSSKDQSSQDAAPDTSNKGLNLLTAASVPVGNPTRTENPLLAAADKGSGTAASPETRVASTDNLLAASTEVTAAPRPKGSTGNALLDLSSGGNQSPAPKADRGAAVGFGLGVFDELKNTVVGLHGLGTGPKMSTDDAILAHAQGKSVRSGFLVNLTNNAAGVATFAGGLSVDVVGLGDGSRTKVIKDAVADAGQTLSTGTTEEKGHLVGRATTFAALLFVGGGGSKAGYTGMTDNMSMASRSVRVTSLLDDAAVRSGNLLDDAAARTGSLLDNAGSLLDETATATKFAPKPLGALETRIGGLTPAYSTPGGVTSNFAGLTERVAGNGGSHTGSLLPTMRGTAGEIGSTTFKPLSTSAARTQAGRLLTASGHAMTEGVDNLAGSLDDLLKAGGQGSDNITATVSTITENARILTKPGATTTELSEAALKIERATAGLVEHSGGSLGRNVEQVTRHVSTLLGNTSDNIVSRKLSGLTDEIGAARALPGLSDNVATSLDDLERSVNTFSTTANRQSALAGIEQTIQKIAAENPDLARTLSRSIEGLDDAVKLGGSATESLVRRTAPVIDNVAPLVDNLAPAADNVAPAVTESARTLTGSVDDLAKAAGSGTDNVSTAVRKELETIAENAGILSKPGATTDEMSRAALKLQQASTNLAQHSAGPLGQNISRVTDDVSRLVTSASDDIVSRKLSGLTDEIGAARALPGLSDNVATSLDDLERSVNTFSTTANRQSALAGIEQTIQKIAAENPDLARTLSRSIEGLDDAVKLGGSATESLVRRTAPVIDNVAPLVDNLAPAADNVAPAVTESARTLTGSVDDLAKAAGSGTDNVSTAVRKELETIAENAGILSKPGATTDEMSRAALKLQQASTNLAQHSGGPLGQNISRVTDDVSRLVTSASDDIVSRKLSGLTDEIGAARALPGLSDNVATSLDDLERSVNTFSTTANRQSALAGIERTIQKIAAENPDLARTLSRSIEGLDDAVKLGGSATESLVRRTAPVIDNVAPAVTESARTLTGSVDDLAKAAGSGTDNVSTAVRKELETIAENAGILSKPGATTDEMSRAALKLQQASTNLAQHSGGPLGQNISRVTDDVSRLVTSASDDIVSRKLSGLTDEIGAARALPGLSDNVATSLDDLERSVNTFSTTANRQSALAGIEQTIQKIAAENPDLARTLSRSIEGLDDAVKLGGSATESLVRRTAPVIDNVAPAVTESARTLTGSVDDLAKAAGSGTDNVSTAVRKELETIAENAGILSKPGVTTDEMSRAALKLQQASTNLAQHSGGPLGQNISRVTDDVSRLVTSASDDIVSRKLSGLTDGIGAARALPGLSDNVATSLDDLERSVNTFSSTANRQSALAGIERTIQKIAAENPDLARTLSRSIEGLDDAVKLGGSATESLVRRTAPVIDNVAPAVTESARTLTGSVDDLAKAAGSGTDNVSTAVRKELETIAENAGILSKPGATTDEMSRAALKLQQASTNLAQHSAGPLGQNISRVTDDISRLVTSASDDIVSASSPVSPTRSAPPALFPVSRTMSPPASTTWSAPSTPSPPPPTARAPLPV